MVDIIGCKIFDTLMWEEEMLDQVKGIGKAKQQQLAAIGYTKVNQLKNTTINQLQDASGNKFSLTSLIKLQEPATVRIDHRQADNPYLSCYSANWES